MSIKSQALANFVFELNSPIEEDPPLECELPLDGASNIKGSGVRIMLEGPRNKFIEEALKFEFSASNNQAKYEAFIVSMILTLEMGATRLKEKGDSQLVAN